MTSTSVNWIAFAQATCIASGVPRDVASAVKAWVDANSEASVLVFDASSSEPVEIDLRGSLADVLAGLPVMADECLPEAGEYGDPPVRAPGRPKLGVTAREVTLLPRHWDWLSSQSGSASVALRKLVEQAMRANADGDRLRAARESAYRFMTAMAGNEAGHEEAVRALFADDTEKLRALTANWPADIRVHVLKLAGVSGEGR